MASGGDANIFLKAKSDHVSADSKLILTSKKGCLFVLVHDHKYLKHRRKNLFVFDEHGRYGFIQESQVKRVKLSKTEEEDFLAKVKRKHESKVPRTNPLSGNSCIAVDTYIPPPAHRAVSLHLEVNDVIQIDYRADGGWFYGTCREKKGWFPKHFVRECSLHIENKERLIYHFTVEATNSHLGQGSELAFSAKDRLDIIKRPMSTDTHWIARNAVGKIGQIPKSHVDERPEMHSVLRHFEWYHETCSRNGAESLLKNYETPNHFLVRDSESFPGCFTINVTTGVKQRILNVAVEVSMSEYKVNGESFETLQDLVTYFGQQPIFDSAPELNNGYKIYLLHPVRRDW